MISYNDTALQNILAAYEELIQERYPSINVIPDSRFADEYGVFLCAVGVADDQRGEFTAFALDELAPKIDEKGLEVMGILPYSLAEAEEIFPDVHEQLRRKKKQALLKYALVSPKTSESWITQALCGSTEVHAPISTFRGRSNLIRHAGGRYSKVKLSDTPFVDDSELIGSAA